MKTKSIPALLVASFAVLAAPAFASGYGPAPFYRPDMGAPASQRGQNAETLAAEMKAYAAYQTGVGGCASQSGQSGARMAQPRSQSLYRGQ